MQKVKGNIWNYYGEGSYMIVPTNLGWKKDNSNVMGAGIALQAKQKFPDLPLAYGTFCRSSRGEEGLMVFKRMIMFPTKSLNISQPYLSWQAKSSLKEIENSCFKLLELFAENEEIFESKTYLPLVGCGNGELDEKDVMPILEEYFGKLNNIYLVRYI